MVWRGWSFLAGMPLGALAATGCGGGLAPGMLGALLGGLALLLAVAVLHRLRDDDPARGALLARAASSGLAALPALVAASLALGPGPVALLALQLPIVAGALWQASRSHGGPSGPWAQVGAATAWLVASALWTLAAAIASALASDSGALGFPERVAVRDELGARVAALPVPTCSGAAITSVRLDRGAHPRLDPDGAWLWFDAAVDGVRQVHAIELATGRTLCRTCGEAGDNTRPYPGPTGVVFETDRYASWKHPANSELHFARGGAKASEPSQRLTRDDGPDDHAVLAPHSAEVVWSRRRGGGYEIVSASLVSAHGGLLLGGQSVWVRGGGDWIAPIEWSRGARALVVARGNPLAPRRAQAIDFGGGRVAELSSDLAPGAAAIDGAGGVWALASTRRASVIGLLPSLLVAPLAPLSLRYETRGAPFRETTLRVGAADSPSELALPGFALWGAPTGVALSRDGTRVFLAQRAAGGAERILEIRRSCPQAGEAGAQRGVSRAKSNG